MKNPLPTTSVDTQSTPSEENLRSSVQRALDEGRIADAYDPLRHLVDHDPSNVPMRTLLGIVCSQIGRTEEAEFQFSEVIATETDNADIRHNLAVLYCSQNRLSEAAKQFEAILELHPGDYQAINDLAVLRDCLEMTEEAAELFGDLVRKAPQYEKGWSNALEFAHRTGRMEEGRTWISRLYRSKVDSPALTEWTEKFAATE